MEMEKFPMKKAGWISVGQLAFIFSWVNTCVYSYLLYFTVVFLIGPSLANLSFLRLIHLICIIVNTSTLRKYFSSCYALALHLSLGPAFGLLSCLIKRQAQLTRTLEGLEAFWDFGCSLLYVCLRIQIQLLVSRKVSKLKTTARRKSLCSDTGLNEGKTLDFGGPLAKKPKRPLICSECTKVKISWVIFSQFLCGWCKLTKNCIHLQALIRLESLTKKMTELWHQEKTPRNYAWSPMTDTWSQSWPQF